MNGPVINKNGLYLNAKTKSSLTIETSILVIPHPGHLIPVNSYKMQGILRSVNRIKIKYATPISKIAPYFIDVFFSRLTTLGSVSLNCFIDSILS